jgi:hypothetical protein
MHNGMFSVPKDWELPRCITCRALHICCACFRRGKEGVELCSSRVYPKPQTLNCCACFRRGKEGVELYSSRVCDALDPKRQTLNCCA